MTHDELLAQINFCDQSSISFDGVNSRLGYALRAVVELCKKAENDIDVSGFAEGIIEAIEKELK